MQRKCKEKGYPAKLIHEAFISHIDPSSKSRKVVDKQPGYTARFVSTYNNKYRRISKITHKHYKILLLDQCLAPMLPPTSQITFKKAWTIKNILAPSKLSIPNKRPLTSGHISIAGQASSNVIKGDALPANS